MRLLLYFGFGVIRVCLWLFERVCDVLAWVFGIRGPDAIVVIPMAAGCLGLVVLISLVIVLGTLIAPYSPISLWDYVPTVDIHWRGR